MLRGLTLEPMSDPPWWYLLSVQRADLPVGPGYWVLYPDGGLGFFQIPPFLLLLLKSRGRCSNVGTESIKVIKNAEWSSYLFDIINNNKPYLRETPTFDWAGGKSKSPLSFFNFYFAFRQCRFFVLDEADGLLKGGYEKFINRIHQTIPKITSDGKRLQVKYFQNQFKNYKLTK